MEEMLLSLFGFHLFHLLSVDFKPTIQ